MEFFIHTREYRAWLNLNEGKDFIDSLLIRIQSKPEIIKASQKHLSLKIDNLFIKKTTYNTFEGFVRHLFFRKRCKNAWIMGNYLETCQIPTPKVIGYIDLFKYSVPYQHIFISEFLHSSLNVENFIKNEVYLQKGLPLDVFFQTLSNLILSLWRNNVYHKDVSGKNFLTIDGKKIFIIDLDSAVIIHHIPLKSKIKSLVQLYDSFCDFTNEEILNNFVLSLLPEINKDRYLDIINLIKKLQVKRRTKHLTNLTRCRDKKNV